MTRPDKTFPWTPPQGVQADPPLGKTQSGFIADDPVYSEWLNAKWANDYEWKKHLGSTVSSVPSIQDAVDIFQQGDRFFLDSFDSGYPTPMHHALDLDLAQKAIAISSDGINVAVLNSSGFVSVYRPAGSLLVTFSTGGTPFEGIPSYIYADGSLIVVAYSTGAGAANITGYTYSGTEEWSVPLDGAIDAATKCGPFFFVKKLGSTPRFVRVRMDGDNDVGSSAPSGTGLATDGNFIFTSSDTQIFVYGPDMQLIQSIPYAGVGAAAARLFSDWGSVYAIDAEKCIRLVVSINGDVYSQTETTEIKFIGQTKWFVVDANYIYAATGFVYDKRTLRLARIYNVGPADTTPAKPAFVVSDNNHVFYAYQKFDGSAKLVGAKINAPPTLWMCINPSDWGNHLGLRAVPANYFSP